MARSDYLIGGDPEFFVIDGNGDYVGAWNFFPGTKDEPFELMGGSVQVDGFAVEINIDPANTYEKFSDTIDSLISQCREFIPSDHNFSFVPVATFKKDYFEGVANEHKVLGCAPSRNVAKGIIQDPPPLTHSNVRYAGGHIHIGFPNMDVDLDNPLTQHILDKKAEDMINRLRTFVNQGPSLGYRHLVNQRLTDYDCRYSVRHKSYGLELRGFSNWWANPNADKYHLEHFFDSLQCTAESC